jgi:hypothetical protein
MCGDPLGNVFPPASTPPLAPAIPPVSPAPPPVIPSQAPYTPPTPAPYVPPVPAPAPYQPPAPPIYPTYESPPVREVPQPLLKLVHVATGREFYLPSGGGYIGRHSPSNPTIPEIDLAGIADEAVVSRKHARCYWDAAQNAYLILDNSSRNGTSLNGTTLKAGTPYRVESGALLQLGQDNLVNFRIIIG